MNILILMHKIQKKKITIKNLSNFNFNFMMDGNNGNK